MQQWKCSTRQFRDTWIGCLKADSNLQISDGTIPGLYLRYSAATHKIKFYLGYKIRHSTKRRNLLLGRYGEIKLPELKEQALELRKQISRGQDPMFVQEEERKQVEKEEEKKIKMAVLFEEYMNKYAKIHKKPSTQVSNKAQFKLYVGPKFGHKYMTDIEDRHINNAYADWVQKTSFSTANKALSLMSDFWNWCARNGYVPKGYNPCRDVKKGTNPKYIPKVLEPKEYKALFAALEQGQLDSGLHPRFFRAIRVLALTGCRYQEITQLELDEIDIPNKRLHLKKSKVGPRDVKLSDAVIPDIELAVKEACSLGSHYAFPGVLDNSKGLYDARKAFQWALKKAHLPHMRIHDLRHSFISLGANSDQNIMALKDAAGHTRVTTTEGYAHVGDAATYKAVNSITAQMLGE